jgi:hypothetical protein
MRADSVPQRSLPRVMPGTMLRRPGRARFFQHPAPPRSVRSPEKVRPSQSYSAKRRSRRGPTQGNNGDKHRCQYIQFLVLLLDQGHIFNRGLSGDN